jgi:thioredoxin reductase (NADPH)
MEQSMKEPMSERAAREQLESQLEPLFKDFPHEVPMLLFTQPGKNDLFSSATRFLIRAVREVAPKVSLREYDLSHKMAKKWNIERAPTLLLDPDRYRIRWLGAPIGEEARTMVEALLMMGHRTGGLSGESLKVLKKIDSERQVKVFVSPSCPYCPQQAVNALKAAIEKPEVISLEIIDIQANPDLADQYSAQSVPQTYSNEVLIAQGAQPEELFMLSLQKMEQQTVFIPDSDAEEVEADLVIVGGGPAGLTAGIYGARSGLRVVIIERGALGGQVATTPVVENYPALTQVGGKTLVDLMVSHALQYVTIFPGEEVMEIEPGEPILLATNRRRFKARAVLLATGAVYRHLNVPGESHLSGHGVSYCSTCDGPLFKGKSIIMVGGGDSAVTEALHLHNIGVKVTVVHRRDRFRAQEHLVKNLFANHIPVFFNTEVKEIRGTSKVEEVVLFDHLKGQTGTLPADGVFIAVGYAPAVELAKKIGIELTPEGYIKKDAHHRTNIPGIYSAGDVEGGYKQIVTAAGQGAEAAMTIFEDLVNPYWKSKRAAA